MFCFQPQLTDRRTDRHAVKESQGSEATSLFTSAMGTDGRAVEVLASFILLDWLYAVTNLGSPPIRKRGGEGVGLVR